jgi:hypothetical protein
MYIKPRHVQTQDGFVLANVYDPERRDQLPPEGRDVPDTPYWRRRVAEGGVEFVELSAEVAAERAMPNRGGHRPPPSEVPQ